MKRLLIGVVVGIVAGSATTYLLVPDSSVRPHIPIFSQPRPIDDVPKMSVEAAETHRQGSYTEIQTIEDTLALPTDFAQTEALYILAGRSDAREVQDLIFQANQIADPGDRRGGLQILFSRLTELDPPSALALSQTREYSTNSKLEGMVWVEWGRNDIHNALIAASELQSETRRNLAAQALYSAYGGGGDPTIALIEDALGIPPNRNTKAQYLYSLADESPAQAIAYVEGQPSMRDQQTLTYWLASYLGRSGPENAQQYADLFTNPRNRSNYINNVTAATSESSPEATIDQALAAGGDQRQRMMATAALMQIAARDPDKAIAYMSQASTRQEMQMFAIAIAAGMAESDPDRAMQWALQQDSDGRLNIYSRVLSTIAQTDPRRALDAALTVENSSVRARSLQTVLGTVASTDPLLAISYLEQIDNKEIEQAVTHQVVQSWARFDPQAAIEWVLAHDEPDQRRLMRNIGSMIIHQDAQAAIRLLPRLDDETANNWRVQIAASLATYASVAKTQAFLAQYKGQDNYRDMFRSAVQGLANSDFQTALQMTHTLPDGVEKDSVLNSLAQQRLEVDPADSVRLISMISSPEQRVSATQQVVRNWHRLDPDGAATWARNLPRGQQRDAAIVGLASAWDDVTPSRKMLLKSVGDVAQRQQAQLSVLYKVARTDLASAERLVLEFDFTDEYRQHVEQALQQSQRRY